MRLGVDGRSLRGSASSRGIARYVQVLLAALIRAVPDDEYVVLVPGTATASARDLEDAGAELRVPRMGSRPLFAAAALAGRPRLDRLVGGCDVAFVPAVAPVAVSPEVPLVLTVHDLSFEHRPADFTPYERAWHRVTRPRRLAHRAERVIAVSEPVRRDVIGEWDVPPEKVVTIPSGPGSAPGPPAPLPRDLPEPYVLAVGALEPRKRPDLLVEAHSRARADGLAAGLVLAGEGPLREELARSQATLLGFVPDELLDALYRNALALVCVSDEEGFAFTPLEALARGTPAVVSDLPVFGDTVAGGALRVPPGDVDALAQALIRLEREPGLREELVAAGAGALAGLSWERAALRTSEVLHETCALKRAAHR